MKIRQKLYCFEIKITILILSILSSIIFCQSTLFAASHSIPEPTAKERELLRLFEKFDDMYVERQSGTISGNRWERMGERFSDTLGEIGKQFSQNWDDMETEFLREWNTFKGQDDIGVNFFLRSALIMGECYLFASQQYFPKYMDLYEKGINTLDQVIIAYEILATISPNEKAKIDFLPDYIRDYEWIKETEDYRVTHRLQMNPFAGRETIGTGIRRSRVAGVVERKVTYDKRPYFGLRQFLEIIQDDIGSLIFYKQISTTETARTLLSHFCPWGTDMYLFLQDAGLTKDLDLRILRPFSGYKVTPLEQLIKGFKEFPDAIMGKPVASEDKIPPVISESVLKPPQIPKHIFDEMALIVGENGKGYLDTDKKKPIEWAWVEKEPTYTVWYTSPTVFDWQPSDYLWLWFTAVKFFLSPGSTVVDEVLNGLVTGIGEFSDKENNIYFAAKVSVDLNDKVGFATGLIEEGQWLRNPTVWRKISAFAFSVVEKQMLEDRSEGIDPAKFSMGTSYNGTKIPPIIIRAEVFGFEKVPDDEYLRTVKAVRFYLLYPENIAHKGPYQGYDLQNTYDVNISDIVSLYRKEQYLTEQNRFQVDSNAHESVRTLAWRRLPDRLAAFDILTDFSPKRQRLEFQVTEETRGALKADDEVFAELWTTGKEKDKRHTSVVIEPEEKSFKFDLYNKNNRDAMAEIKLRLAASRAGPLITTEPDEDDLLREGLRHYNLVAIHNQYQIKLRVNGRYASRTYHVNFDTGRKSQRKITGNRSYPESGVVKLDYEPQIDIPVAKVEKGEIQPGTQHGDRDR